VMNIELDSLGEHFLKTVGIDPGNTYANAQFVRDTNGKLMIIVHDW
jgi:hypothetical protein